MVERLGVENADPGRIGVRIKLIIIDPSLSDAAWAVNAPQKERAALMDASTSAAKFDQAGQPGDPRNDQARFNHHAPPCSRWN